ncbi:biotin/lipoyl-containing protein [Xanthobacter tagetidis]|uniref:Acetyl-CoA carboxylase biotin carboxyl carrier protein subunit n=1 Tax=Xanthobacter tagetidis TaxID=60216 RepID=A0A3L7AMX2_9HYPH|nr:biotin/lipoyl-containing protein [Xanthobacter tagetidis]MBB6307407.1 urea carboxylase [Xanthobacter tagetidis]RLP81000.1 acetyl-CoA carboxylase biotin carboxyl carrier protein subunit [Xanthobacter tagetidis]
MAQHEVVSSVTGVVFEVAVAEGATVAAGDTLVVVESMKMEIPVVAPRAGRVARLLMAAGDGVDEGQVVAVVED